MNTRKVLRKGQSGSVLMVALVTSLILGISLASYLMLMNHQNTMIARGQAWNHALTLAEAGVEDALAHVNAKFGTNNPIGGLNEWNGPSKGPATLANRRELSGGSYTATISAGMPVITATGRVMVANSTKFIERQVRVTTTTEPAFTGAMAAKRDIIFNGNNITVDSYDSGDQDHSDPDGKYDPDERKAGGDIASTGGFIDVGNADVNGKLYTGPINAGQYSIGPNGSVGDLDWSGPGIQEGWYYNDFNMAFPEVGEPMQTGLYPGPEDISDTNIWTLGTADYKYEGNFSANSTKTIYVKGAATVYVTGTFDMKGIIEIAPGGSLKLYVAGSYARLNEVNTTGNAFSFQYFGLPSNTSLSWGGNDEYVGTIYAPQASLKMGGGGTDPYDYQGSCVVDSINLNGHFSFHFDENLRRRGPVIGYVVSLWEEE